MKTPFLSKEQAESAARDWPTPWHIYDEKQIRDRARQLNEAFSWNPGFREYFAVKATPNPTILKILHEENCGVDCSSLAELEMSRRCGFEGDEIMFSSNATPAEDFRKARELDAVINLDDISHIDFLERETGPLPEVICCRFNPGGNFVVSNDIMDNPEEAKYGMTREQLTEAFLRLKDRGVKRFGMHAFLVSNANTTLYYPKLAELLLRTAVELRDVTGIAVSFINLSGGVGIPYRPDEEASDIAAIGTGVEAAFKRILQPAGMGDVSIYTELGRWLLGPCGALVSRVLHLKHTYRDYVGLDACAANLLRPAMYGAYHHITVLRAGAGRPDAVYDVTGGLCENNDKFAVQRTLPEVRIGDLLYIHDTGAHGFAMGYNYNGKLRSAELLLQEDGQIRQIRRAETVDDYFATLDF